MKFGRLLDPVDRIAEILFGLIMAVTIIGSLSVASAGQTEVRTVTSAAIGCNLAWGLVDAVMYVLRIVTERMRGRTAARAQGQGGAEEALLTTRDVLEAVAVFVVVVAATFPVVVPFLAISDVRTAMLVSQAVAAAMLFAAGVALARYAGYDRPLRAGLVTGVLGVALIAAVKALGG